MQQQAQMNRMVENAVAFSKALGSSVLETEHLLYGVLCVENSLAAKTLCDLGVNKNSYAKVVKSYKKNVAAKISDKVLYSKNVQFILSKVYSKTGETQANIEDVLYFLISKKEFKSYIILASIFKLDIPKISSKIKDSLLLYSQKKSEKKVSYTETLPSELKDLGFDLTAKMANSDMPKIIGRDDEIARTIEILCRKTKNNPILIGEPGVGKSSIVEGLALNIVRGDVPEILLNKIVFSFDLASLMAGTKFRGSMEEKLKKAIDAIISNPNIIVFIDEVHMLYQVGNKEGDISPSDILKPYLARGEIRCIGATTISEYKKNIEKDPALERRFQPVDVEEPNVSDAVAIIKNIRPSYENFHGVRILDEAIYAAVNLSVRYITNRFLPDKAIDLIDEACSKLKISLSEASDEIKELNKKILQLDRKKSECIKEGREDFLMANQINQEKTQILNKITEIRAKEMQINGKIANEISADNIRQVVSVWSKIPVNKLSSTEKEMLVNLEKIIGARVFGQDEAVSVVANAIRRSKADINDPNKPIGSFLFLGPTGVGKTELAKAVSDVMFNSEDAILRFDMSEFMESHSIARLIGAPPGYVGHEDGGELTDAVKNNPYSVVLFDEIEKAHPDIFNILLQILDEGRLTDSKGKLINFRNTIVIMTSNNGVQELIARRKQEKLQKVALRVSTDEFLMNKLRDKFKPEILNRIDQIVIFDTLSKESVLKITNLMLDSFVKRVSKKGIRLVITDSCRSLICDKGYDEEYGARPIKKVIDKEIKDILANMIIKGEIGESSVVKIDACENNFTFDIIC